MSKMPKILTTWFMDDLMESVDFCLQPLLPSLMMKAKLCDFFGSFSLIVGPRFLSIVSTFLFTFDFNATWP